MESQQLICADASEIEQPAAAPQSSVSSRVDEPLRSSRFQLPFTRGMDSLSTFSPTTLSPIPSVSLTEQAASVRRQQLAQRLAESRQLDDQGTSPRNGESLHGDLSCHTSSPQISLPSDRSDAPNQASSFALDPGVQPPPPHQENGSLSARSRPRQRQGFLTNRTGDSFWQRKIWMNRSSTRPAPSVKSSSSTSANAAASTNGLERKIGPGAHQSQFESRQDGIASSAKLKKLGRLRRRSASNALAESTQTPARTKKGFPRLSVCFPSSITSRRRGLH